MPMEQYEIGYYQAEYEECLRRLGIDAETSGKFDRAYGLEDLQDKLRWFKSIGCRVTRVSRI